MATTTVELEIIREQSQPQHFTLEHGEHSPHCNTIPTDQQIAVEADNAIPDGGYGWIVLLACGIMTWWFIGTTYCWGIMQARLVELGLSSPSTLSWIGSLSPAFNALLAILSSRLVRAFGTVKIGLAGIFLLGLGPLLSGFATKSVPGLFVTSGVIMGIGVSLCFMVVSLTPAQYFLRRRGLANGIVYAFGGLGGAVISFAEDGLLKRLDPAWTFRVMGLMIWATALPAACFVRERRPVRTSTMIEWALLRDTKFIILFLAGAFGTFPLMVPPFFLPMYCTAIGQSASVGAGLVAAFNVASAVGRIGFGVLCDVIGPLNSLFCALTLCALSMLVLWPVSSTLAPLIVFVIVNGAANGGFFSTMPTTVSNIFGLARVSIAMGMIVTGWVGGYLMGAPIAGYLLDAYGGEKAGFEAYRPAILFAGSMALGSAGLVAAVRLRIGKKLMEKL